MTATRYRKKPVIIEAWQWHHEREGELRGVCNCHLGNWGSHLHTMHAEQVVMLEAGDWIIPEPDGEHYYPCKPDVFAATYELASAPAQQTLPMVPTSEMLIAARDWSYKEYGRPIGNNAAIGCWQAMVTAALSSTTCETDAR